MFLPSLSILPGRKVYFLNLHFLKRYNSLHMKEHLQFYINLRQKEWNSKQYILGWSRRQNMKRYNSLHMKEHLQFYINLGQKEWNSKQYILGWSRRQNTQVGPEKVNYWSMKKDWFFLFWNYCFLTPVTIMYKVCPESNETDSRKFI